ncbi:hypothetical protein [Caenimonas sedimenti]|nr:hypothetical protein [Caenimonas sedimenti]
MQIQTLLLRWRVAAPWLMAAALVACGGGGGSPGENPPPAAQITLLAGSLQSAGTADGIGTAAQFNGPRAAAQAPDGTIFVADTGNHTIRRIAPDGAVSTLAGAAGQAGAADGAATSARFSSPSGIVRSAQGELFVADTGNHTIRRIAIDGTVFTLAGSAGQRGAVDGTGAAARFDAPRSLAFHADGTLLVADRSGAIRRVRTDGQVTTFAGQLGQSGFVVADGTAARFTILNGIAVDGAGNVVVSEFDAAGSTSVGRLRRFDSLARALPWGARPQGVVEVPMPMGIAALGSGEVLVASSGVFAPVPSVNDVHNSILRIDLAGESRVIAGENGPLGRGSADGPGAAARFNHPEGVAVGIGGRILVADTQNHAIRQIDDRGLVTTVAGGAGIGLVDGGGAAARFHAPASIAALPDGSFLVADSGNARVRRVTRSGQVSTLTFTGEAGTPATGSFQTLGRSVTALAASPQGDVYASRVFTNSLYDLVEIEGTVVRSLLPVWSPVLAAGRDGSLYFASGGGATLDRLRADGTREVLASGFQSAALAVNEAGTVYSAGFDHVIRTVSPAGQVRVLAGAAGQAGANDGDLQSVRFNQPRALTLDAAGRLYVADATGIRRIGVDGSVERIVGGAGQVGAGDDPLLRAVRRIMGLAWLDGVLYATVDHAVLRIDAAR